MNPGAQKTNCEVLVCFAVKEEAAGFKKVFANSPSVRILITGMGKRNAERSVRECLEKIKPARVLSCGFAGGLNPQLSSGAVVFETEDSSLEVHLQKAGGQKARFYFADHVATTASEKRALHHSTKADAVEMESRVIGDVCREQKIPFATVRVILDTADEDLPLDFNALMTADQQMNYWKLAGMLLKSPGKIGALMKFQKQCQAAAASLAQTLGKFISA
jgi:nucleoside phosphorylase